MKRGTNRGDLVICILCLALAGALALPRLFAPPAAVLRITTPAQVIACPLDEDRTFAIQNVEIEIKDGCARVLQSSCPDKLCVKAGRLSRPGDAAACLPARVAIEVLGVRRQSSGSGVDSVAY